MNRRCTAPRLVEWLPATSPTAILVGIALGMLVGGTSAAKAVVHGDMDLLKVIQAQRRASVGSIVTWKGHAVKERQMVVGDTYEYSRRTVVDFALNWPRDLARWNQDTVVNRWIVDGKALPGESSVEAGTKNGMVRQNRFYDYVVLPAAKSRATQTLVVKKREFAGGAEAVFNFDPRYYIDSRIVDHSLEELVNDPNNPDMYEWHITRDGPLVTIGRESNANGTNVKSYVFDLSKGAHLISAHSKGRVAEHHTQYEYEMVDGVWVPASYVDEIINVRDGKRSVLTDKVTWSDSQVNRKLDDSEFAISRLGVKPGDLIQDDLALIRFRYQANFDDRQNLPDDSVLMGPGGQGGVGTTGPARGAASGTRPAGTAGADGKARSGVAGEVGARRYDATYVAIGLLILLCGVVLVLITRRRKLQRTRSLPLLLLAACLPSLAVGVTIAADTNALASASMPAPVEEPQCGHWAVLRACELLGVPIEMPRLVEMLPPAPNGHSLLDLARTFNRRGLRAVGVRMSYDDLIKEQHPVVAHMAPDHFVTVSRSDAERVFLFDGAGRNRILPKAEFLKQWDGASLIVSLPEGGVTPASPGSGGTLGSRAQFSTLIIDKGDVRGGTEPVSFTYTLWNRGDQPLLVRDIKTDCGCVEAVKPEAAIPPGGQGAIVLKYRVAGGRGAFLHHATVFSNDSVSPVVRLTAAGTTDTSVELSSDSVALGWFAAGQPVRALVFVTSHTDEPLRILGLSCADPRVRALSAKVTEDVARRIWARQFSTQGTIYPPRNTHVVEITVTTDAADAGKSVNTTLEVRTSIQGYERLSVRIAGMIVGPALAHPSELVFQLREDSERGSDAKAVYFLSPSGKPLRPVGVENAGDDVEYSIPEERGDEMPKVLFSMKAGSARRLKGKSVQVLVRVEGVQDPVPVRLVVVSIT